MKENEVGGTCGTHGRGKESVQGFGGISVNLTIIKS
jgi:hypothetical protein